MLRFDARGIGNHELFIKLREELASAKGREVSIELLTDTSDSAKKVEAFVAMTGCSSETRENNGYFIVTIKGSPCCI